MLRSYKAESSRGVALTGVTFMQKVTAAACAGGFSVLLIILPVLLQ
jgi:hypothetical protein